MTFKTAYVSIICSYSSAVLISMLCASKQSFFAQYLQAAELQKRFLHGADYNELHKYEEELADWLVSCETYIYVCTDGIRVIG